jgi:hypothetical protein
MTDAEFEQSNSEFVRSDGDRERAAIFGTAAMRLRRDDHQCSRTKEPSVPVGSDSPSVCCSMQSELDRRAMGMASHALMTGIWLEHQPKDTSPHLTGLVGRSGWIRSLLHRLRSVGVHVTQPTRTQPSGTADSTDILR